MRVTGTRKNKSIAMAVCIAAVLLFASAVYAFAPSGCAPLRSVAVKDALNAYSWQELSAIAREISQCEDEPHAIARAAHYNLCENDGTLDPAQVMDIGLAGGATVHATLAGVWQDERTDGGKAGLTFVFTDAPVQHAMNHATDDPNGTNADSVGGWPASDMRAWLAGDFLYELPQDLRAVLASVEKRSVAVPTSSDESSEAGHLSGSAADFTSTTSDKLWLLSVAELCGEVPADKLPELDEGIAQMYTAEGAQYQLFAQQGASALAACPALRRSDATWWLRTKTLEFGEGFWLVGSDGCVLDGIGEDARALDDEYAPDALWGPDHPRGVVAGFCL